MQVDARVIPILLGLGWALATLGLWGACGEPWWLIPMSFGVACLLGGVVLAVAAIRAVSAGAAPTSEGPAEAPKSPPPPSTAEAVRTIA